MLTERQPISVLSSATLRVGVVVKSCQHVHVDTVLSCLLWVNVHEACTAALAAAWLQRCWQHTFPVVALENVNKTINIEAWVSIRKEPKAAARCC